MITEFEKYTARLNEHELDVLVPVLTNELREHVGRRTAIRNKTLCAKFTAQGYTGLTEARVRKCVNYIRMNGLVPHLIANSHGYYCATTVDEVEKYIESLNERATAIWAVRAALRRDLSGRLFI